MAKKHCFLILVVTILIAVAMRLPQLEHRPMHGDEAINAEKFRLLLEEHFYRYNPDEYHGPTLNYLTLAPARLSSAAELTQVSEFTIRIVPVFFGVLLVLLVMLLADGLGLKATVCAAVLTAISPAMVFYSRYYIHEMLLVCFTFGIIACAWRYMQSKNLVWALLTGMSLGLCHATKETCIIAFGSMLLAVLLTRLIGHRHGDFIQNNAKAIRPSHIFAAGAAAAIVSVLFYSSFFANPRGILDSILTYKNYFGRARQSELHAHPWYYYLKILTYFKCASAPIWTEAFVIILAVAGFVVAMTKKGISGVNIHLLRFVGFYTVIMTILYSIIPYKTPWCMLSFLHGMILLAGIGAVIVVKLAPNGFGRMCVIMLLVAAFSHLGWQGYQSSYKYYADPRNPYVYAHPTMDVFTIVHRIEDLARIHPDGRNMCIHVICPHNDYWPLPWYLRFFPPSKIAWWSEVDENVTAASVIIASPSLEQQLIRKLYELPPPGEKNLYVPLFDSYMELRPQIELRGFVTKELWDRYQQHRAQSVQSNTK